MLDEIEKASLAGGAFSESLHDGVGNSKIKHPRPNLQAENRASEITCASLRSAELRGCLIREISRSIAIELQVQAALFDCDDALAIENLRRHWRVMRADVSPMASELDSLQKGSS